MVRPGLSLPSAPSASCEPTDAWPRAVAVVTLGAFLDAPFTSDYTGIGASGTHPTYYVVVNYLDVDTSLERTESCEEDVAGARAETEAKANTLRIANQQHNRAEATQIAYD